MKTIFDKYINVVPGSDDEKKARNEIKKQLNKATQAERDAYRENSPVRSMALHAVLYSLRATLVSIQNNGMTDDFKITCEEFAKRNGKKKLFRKLRNLIGGSFITDVEIAAVMYYRFEDVYALDELYAGGGK